MALDMERALKQLNDVSWERLKLERIASGITYQEEVSKTMAENALFVFR